MKRQKQRQKTKRKPVEAVSAPAPAKEAPKMSRRELFGSAKFYAIGALIFGGGSWLLVEEVRAHIREADLTLVGNGKPSVVQIHDPNCSRCTALQRQARAAMCNLEDEGSMNFLVANLATAEGRAFAQHYGAGSVTLLLFDGAGNLRDVVQGVSSEDYLEGAFRRHLAAEGA